MINDKIYYIDYFNFLILYQHKANIILYPIILIVLYIKVE